MVALFFDFAKTLNIASVNISHSENILVNVFAPTSLMKGNSTPSIIPILTRKEVTLDGVSINIIHKDRKNKSFW